MKLLLDTHTALWLLNEYEKLPSSARDYLRDEANALYISVVSTWEVAIKHSIGKLTEFPGGVKLFISALNDLSIEIITVLPEYVEVVEELPFIHRDPFDRLIIATALCENMTIITADENIQKYDVRYIW